MNLTLYSLNDNVNHDLRQNQFPAMVQTWQGNSLQLSATGTHFGFVCEGNPQLVRKQGNQTYTLHPQMYFCLPNAGLIGGANSSGIMVTYPNYQGMFTLGGAIEPTGRFAYIDGGTNSLLIPPIKLGDPCLNAMYFPSGIDQTFHTHPSYRIGLVVAGAGTIITSQTTKFVTLGSIFVINAHCWHKFVTSNSSLTVIVFHPDSDWGFGDRDNPMLKRTMVDGISATEIPQIQTKLN